MPGSIRLFVPAPLAAGATIAVSAGQAHYLGTVMRRSPGDPVHVFNGRDGEWKAHLADLRRDAASLVVDTPIRLQTSEPDLWLAFALLKRDATDLLVRQATELGVGALWPVVTARTNAQRVNLERLRAIVIEAAEQSERLSVPAVHPPQSLAALLHAWPRSRRLVAAVERTDAQPLTPGHPPVALLIGPEGGFAPAELDLLRAHPLVSLASLGPLILRAETAAIAGLAQLQGEGCG